MVRTTEWFLPLYSAAFLPSLRDASRRLLSLSGWFCGLILCLHWGAALAQPMDTWPVAVAQTPLVDVIVDEFAVTLSFNHRRIITFRSSLLGDLSADCVWLV